MITMVILLLFLFALPPWNIRAKLRFIMVCKMAKPEEVLVVVNDTGEAVREFMKDTDSIEQYFFMREILGMLWIRPVSIDVCIFSIISTSSFCHCSTRYFTF